MSALPRSARPARDALAPELQELADEYTIQAELGRGGTAVVYLAWDRALEREVAVKIIRARYADDDELVARLEREARLVARLSHPNIVGLYSVRRLRHGSLALIMQYVHGHSLRDEVRAHGPLAVARARRVLTDVARALSAAHAHGIVHRDVKPENVRINAASGRALLADFGAAAPLEGDGRLTIPGMTIGTPGYMAPELVDGGDATPASDVYSLGLMAWEMLAGREPWTGTTLFEVLAFRKHGQLPPLAEVRDGLAPGLAEVVDVALATEPAQRWRSVDALLGVLTADVVAPAEPRAGPVAAPPVAPGRVPSIPPILAAPAHPADARVGAAPDDLRVVPPPGAADADGEARIEESAGDPAADLTAAAASPPQATRGRRRLMGAAAFVLVAAGVAFGAASLRQRARTAPIASGADTPSGRQVLVAPPAAVPAPTDSVRPTPAPDGAAIDPAAPIPADGSPAAAAADAQPPDSEAPPPVAPAPVPEPESRTEPPRSTPTLAPTPPPVLLARERAGSAAAPSAVRRVEVPTAASDEREDAGATGGLAVRGIGLGGKHSCGLLASGRVVCWGANERGQLGSRAADRQPVAVPLDAGLRFRALALGLAHSCGVGSEGTPLCWGANDRGQLGSGTRTATSIPGRVAEVPRVTAMAVGHSHGCAIATDGAAYCWGANDRGQLGTGDTDDRRMGERVESVMRFTTIAAGWHHSCAVTADGRAYCWGANGDGQLGVEGGDREAPSAVPTSTRIRSLVAGSAHTCALTSDEAVLCWGRNREGQIGDGSRSAARAPRRVALPGPALAVAAGTQHTCALVRGGDVYCWGQNRYGQLGDGTTLDTATPTRVVDVPALATIDASGAHTCGVTGGRAVYCWGYNLDGQLGDGTRVNRARPVLVLAPVE